MSPIDTFPGFVRFLFDWPVPTNDKEEREHMEALTAALGLDEDVLEESLDVRLIVRHATARYRDLPRMARGYSDAQVREGVVWHLHFVPFWLCQRLGDPAVPQDEAAACIEALYDVYAGYVKGRPSTGPKADFEMVCDEYGHYARDDWPGNFSAPLRHVLLRTFERILLIDDRGCQDSALAGLWQTGAVPGCRGVLDRFIREHGAAAAPETLDLAIRCRDRAVA